MVSYFRKTRVSRSDELSAVPELTEEEIKTWQLRISESKPSVVFREIAFKYDLGLADLAALLSNLYSGLDLNQLYIIWKWDIHEKGRGLKDHQIDQLFLELSFKQT
jgi:hypothetical protein